MILHADRIALLRVSTLGKDIRWLWDVLHAGLPNLEDLFITSSGMKMRKGNLDRLPSDKLPLLSRLTVPLQLFRYFPTVTLQELTFLWKDSGRRRHDPEGSTSIGALLRGLDGQPKLKVLRVCDDTFLVNDRDHHALVLPALE